jgi:predicted aspartyl protease
VCRSTGDVSDEATTVIRGTVNARLEAVVRLRVRGPSGAALDVDAVVDSGFSSSLTLPSATVASRGLARQSGGSAVLGDGSIRSFDVYAAEVDWDGTRRRVLVSCIGSEVLVGMRLLAGHALRVAVAPGGAVEIEALP